MLCVVLAAATVVSAAAAAAADGDACFSLGCDDAESLLGRVLCVLVEERLPGRLIELARSWRRETWNV